MRAQLTSDKSSKDTFIWVDPLMCTLHWYVCLRCWVSVLSVLWHFHWNMDIDWSLWLLSSLLNNTIINSTTIITFTTIIHTHIHHYLYHHHHHSTGIRQEMYPLLPSSSSVTPTSSQKEPTQVSYTILFYTRLWWYTILY